VHELYAGEEIRDVVVARWGPRMAPGGVVDRAQIARKVFGDQEERAWLEGELWPRVGAHVWGWYQGLATATPPPPAAIVESPLLFEAGMEAAYDATIAVVADEPVREARAAARGHEAVAERAARQLSQDEKARRATYTVHNDGTEADLEAALSDVLAKLVG
jgi:dephospho-CoA kinase